VTESAGTPADPPRPAEGLRLVVVDNDEAVLELLLLDLRLEGHDVVATAANGEQALAACAAHRPDVAVVDLRLGPGIDGLEVARHVGPTGPRVVLYTNYVTPEVVRAADAAGATVVEKGNLKALRRAIAG
jgi:CheY-like chemotaxis protein